MKNLTFKSILKLAIATVFFCSFNNLVKNVPFGISLIIPLCSAGFSPILVFISFAISAFACFYLSNFLLLLISAFLLCLICAIYSHFYRKIKFESCLFILLVLLPFFVGDFGIIIYKKLAYSAIIALFAPILSQAFKLVFVKKFSLKWELDELFALALFGVVFSYGLINFLSLEFVYIINIFALLLVCFFYKDSRAFFCAVLLSLPIAIFTKHLQPIALFCIYTTAALAFIKRSKLLSALLVIAIQTAYAFFSGVLLTFDIPLLICYFLPFVLFLFLPTTLLKRFEKKLKRFDEPLLTREIINSERAEISNRLYNLSAVFCTLNQAITQFSPLYLNSDEIKDKICDEIVINICENCSYLEKCRKNNRPMREDLLKLLSIGMTKGRVNLIDLSRDFSTYCYCTNNMIGEINKLLCEYEKNQKIKTQTDRTIGLVSLESNGVSEVLKQMAFEFAGKMTFDRNFELELFNHLCKHGIIANQILAVGQNIHIVLPSTNTDCVLIAQLLSQKLCKKMRLLQNISLGKNILAIFTPAPNLDACFGVSQRTKKGSKKSGDTHSLTRIDGNNFIAVLCDGMGSGEIAYSNSQTAISLIEAFFKAKLDKNTCIDLTNRMLSLCEEDSFCALDLAIVDLANERADLIKIGATFGAYISGNDVQIVENNALPLGILQEIAPTSASFKLLDGDMIVLLSDGVTDAFFSSTDTLDFLQRERCLNPQTLADKLIDFAFDKNGGVAKDDMTAVVVKIYRTN